MEEITAFDLPVEGSIPPELCGLYARNGANPRNGHSEHWFLGDGMIHGVSLRNGKAEWYRNRWVRTPCFAGEPRTPSSALDLRFSLANTSIVAHAKRVFALVENALPMEMTRELDTVGFYDFGGALQTPFTAHPKICPLTGEMHFFGYRVVPPFLTYHVANADGALLRSLEIPVKGATMIHDFALTAGHVIFMDLPVVFDIGLAMRGTMPFIWSETYGARLGILPRGAGIEKLRWVEVRPGYVYHVANAFESTDGTIVIDVAWYKDQWRSGPEGKSSDGASLKRWRLAPGAQKAEELQIDGRKMEFPRIDDRPHVFGEAEIPSEFVMVPASPEAGEDEGWIVGFVYDRARDASDLLLLDAQKIEAKPIARIRLPKRVPQGFHGSWIPSSMEG
jgi:carotenoid cleavage dioxygenase